MPYLHGRFHTPAVQLVVPGTYPIMNGLPQDRLLTRLILKFVWEITISGGAASGAVLQDAVLRLIPEVKIIGDNVASFYRDYARHAYHLNTNDYGAPFWLVDPTSGDEASYDIGFMMVIDFQNNIGFAPQDSYLDATALKTLDMLIQFADPTVMFDATFDRDIAVDSGWLYTIVEQDTQPAPRLLRFQDYKQQEITATMPNFETQLNVGSEIYQRLSFMTTDDTVRESDIINLTSIISGDKYHHRQVIRDPMDIVAQWALSGVEVGNQAAGFLVAPLTRLGRVNTGLITSDVKSAKVIHDVTVGAATTMLYTHTDLMRLIA
ncbi:hypothetical protein ES702_05891 [subsurface metagenome]